MKRIFLVTVILTITVTVKAQDKQPSSFGVKAGVNIYTLNGDDYEESGYKNQIGLHGGIFYQIPVATLFSVQPELMYSSEGIKYEDEDLKADVHLNYLNLPVMFQFVTPSGLYAETGPQIGFLLNGKAKYEETGGDKYEEELDEDINKTAFS